MTSLSVLFVLAIVLYTATVAVTDIRSRRIPNGLTVVTALLGFVYHGLAAQGDGLLTALAGFTVGFGLLLLPWFLGVLGMGDIKLLAALGTWLGPTNILIAFAASILLAGLFAVVPLIWASVRRRTGDASQQTIDGGQRTLRAVGDGRVPLPRERRVLPFALVVALSTWGILAWSAVQQTI